MSLLRISTGLFIAIAGLTAPASARAQALERINPPELYKYGTISQAVRAGNLLFVSGQVGTDKDGEPVSIIMSEQVEQALKNLKTVLATQNADFSHIAKTTIYVTNISEFGVSQVQEVMKKYFGDAKRAGTLVQVGALADPALKFEIDAIVVLPGR